MASARAADDDAPPAAPSQKAAARAVLSELQVTGVAAGDVGGVVEKVVTIQRTFRGNVVRLAMREVIKEARKPLSCQARRPAHSSAPFCATL